MFYNAAYPIAMPNGTIALSADCAASNYQNTGDYIRSYETSFAQFPDNRYRSWIAIGH